MPSTEPNDHEGYPGDGSTEPEEHDVLLRSIEQDVQLLVAILDHYVQTETGPPAFLHTAKVTAERALELITRLRATGNSDEPGR